MTKVELAVAEMRSGFDLKSLMALLAVGFPLLSLLIVVLANASTMTTATRISCQNNQHEIWTAVQVFEARKQRYPSWRTELADRQVAWPVLLMPYLGMHEYYDVWATKGSQPTMLKISMYVCPNDEQETKDGPWLSYVVNCGVPDALTGDKLVETPAHGLFFDGVVTDKNPKPIITNASEVQKKDGLAHTLGLGENLRVLGWTGYAPGTETVQEYLVGFNWQHYAKPPAEHWLQYPVNQRDDEKELLTRMSTNSNAARLNSRHGNTVNVTFADGHWIALFDQIDEQVYNKLCTPDGKALNQLPLAKTEYVK